MEPGCSDERPGCLFAAAQTQGPGGTTLGTCPTDQVTTMKTEAETEQLRDVYTDRGPAEPALAHAVVRTDHQQARVLEFAEAQVQSRTLHLHAHPTSQHRSNVRAEHEFFGAVCDALDGIGQVLSWRWPGGSSSSRRGWTATACSELDHHVPQLGVELQRMHPTFAPDP